MKFQIIVGLALITTAIASAEDSRYIYPKSNYVAAVDKYKKKHTTYLISKNPRVMPWHLGTSSRGPAPQGGAPVGLTPHDVRLAYQLPSSGGNNAIAIVDAQHLPTALSDFNTFSQTFGLPTEPSTDPLNPNNKVFQVVYAQGVKPADDPGWGGEIALDIEWAHAMAPSAKIYLVEANSAFNVDLYAAVQVAASLPGVKQVSMSWGGPEFSEDLNTDQQVFNRGGVVFFCSTGDNGSSGFDQNYPSESPYVVGVGGTRLTFDAAGNFVQETAWGDAGGGPSAIHPRPSYQDVVANVVGTHRGAPDVGALADPESGAAVYSQFALGGWAQIGGTSLACPLMAAVTNLRGSRHTSTLQELDFIYHRYYGGPNFRDITVGNSGPFPALPGWDYVTGIGSPLGMLPNELPPFKFGPQSISTFEGIGSGTLKDIIFKDGSTYNIKSQFIPRLGGVASARVGLALTQSPTKMSSLTMSFNTSGPNLSSMFVFAWNYRTSTWDSIKAYPQVGTMRSQTMDISALALKTGSDYIRSGAMQFVFRDLLPSRYGTSTFTWKMDSLSLSGARAE